MDFSMDSIFPRPILARKVCWTGPGRLAGETMLAGSAAKFVAVQRQASPSQSRCCRGVTFHQNPELEHSVNEFVFTGAWAIRVLGIGQIARGTSVESIGASSLSPSPKTGGVPIFFRVRQRDGWGMKNILILMAASVALVACNRDETANESAGAQKERIEQNKDATKDALRQRQKEISSEAKAQKTQIDAQADAEKARLDAEKKKAEADAAAAKAQAEADQKARDAEANK